jgi:hypothetical protein
VVSVNVVAKSIYVSGRVVFILSFINFIASWMIGCCEAYDCFSKKPSKGSRVHTANVIPAAADLSDIALMFLKISLAIVCASHTLAPELILVSA